jgi:hypothetical protein
MDWKPIEGLTGAEFGSYLHRRLMVWNSCQGAYHACGLNYSHADDIKDEGIWEKYLVLPEID